MKVVTIAIIVWAIIIGFFVSGIRVMATSPTTMTIQSATAATTGGPQQVNVQRPGPSGTNAIRPAGNQGSTVGTLAPN